MTDIDERSAALLRQAALLDRVDVAESNAAFGPPPFDSLKSCAVSAEHFEHPDFLKWESILKGRQGELVPAGVFKHRKTWEWAYILEVIDGFGLYRAGKRGIGFGVGSEPLAAMFARVGADVLATDQPVEQGGEWDVNGQLMHGLATLSHPDIVSDEQLAEHVSVRPIDMNHLPDDLGTFDFTWSSCVIEHLGSPHLGFEFVRNASRLLRPGGVSVHTTELELIPREHTMDYGNCAVFRPSDLLWFGESMRAEGFEVDVNLHVAMDSPADRFISLVDGSLEDAAHLKLVIGDSVSTSFAIVVHRPAVKRGLFRRPVR